MFERHMAYHMSDDKQKNVLIYLNKKMQKSRLGIIACTQANQMPTNFIIHYKKPYMCLCYM
jgi:hypothetical protein